MLLRRPAVLTAGRKAQSCTCAWILHLSVTTVSCINAVCFCVCSNLTKPVTFHYGNLPSLQMIIVPGDCYFFSREKQNKSGVTCAASRATGQKVGGKNARPNFGVIRIRKGTLPSRPNLGSLPPVSRRRLLVRRFTPHTKDFGKQIFLSVDPAAIFCPGEEQEKKENGPAIECRIRGLGLQQQRTSSCDPVLSTCRQ